MGVVPQKPPPKVNGKFTTVELKTGSRFYGAWECEYCHTYTLTSDEKCRNCGAPRKAEARLFEPSFVETPADRHNPPRPQPPGPNFVKE